MVVLLRLDHDFLHASLPEWTARLQTVRTLALGGFERGRLTVTAANISKSPQNPEE